MHDTADMQARHGRILAELAEIGMTIAREMQVQVLAAETPEAKAQAAAAYPRVARAVRQSLALEAKLQRDQARDDREERQAADRELGVLVQRRKTRVRLHMQRAIAEAFAEADDTGDAVAMRLEDLRDRLDDDLLEPDFALAPFHEVIAVLHRALGMDPPDFGPDDGFGDDPDDPEGDTAAAPDTPPPEPAPEPDVRDSSG